MSDKTGTSSPPPKVNPLAGVVVIETTSADAPDALRYATGLCGRMAADLGARVIRIEIGPGRVQSDLFLHAGKEQLSVSHKEWLLLLTDLVEQADIVVCDSAVENQIDGFGNAVPVLVGMSLDARGTGSEFTVEARSGLLDLVGDPDRKPLRLGGHQTAYAGGIAAYLGMVHALTRRDEGLETGPIRVDLLDVAVWLNWKTLGTTARTGISPTRAGTGAEWLVVPCADGYVALVYRPADWRALLSATGEEKLADERFATPAGRRENRGELNTVFAEAFGRFKRADIRAMAIAMKLPLGPVWTPAELLNDPHMIARGFFRRIEADGSGATVPILPAIWNGWDENFAADVVGAPVGPQPSHVESAR